jgi:quinol monooxygenase YgiN
MGVIVMSNQFRYTLVLKIKDIEQFNYVATKIIAEIDSEVGTLAFQMYVDEQNSKCVIYEQFADSDAWITHGNSHAATVFLPELFKHSDIERFEVLGDVSDEVKEIMDGMGATYLKRTMGFEK